MELENKETINKSLEHLLFVLIENKSHRWDVEQSALIFNLGGESKLYAFENEKGFNIMVSLDSNNIKAYLLIVQRSEIINFIKEISVCGERNFELSYEKDFPNDFKRIISVTDNVLKGNFSDSRYKISSQKIDNKIIIQDNVLQCINSLNIHYPDYEKYMGNFHIDCNFYPYKGAPSAMTVKKIIPPEFICEYPFLNSLLIPSKEDLLVKPTNIEKFLIGLKQSGDVNISSIAMMIEMEKYLSSKGKDPLRKI